MIEYQFRKAEQKDMDWLFALNKDSYEAVVIQQFGEWDHSFQKEMFDSNWKDRKAEILVVGGEDSGVLSTSLMADHFWVQEIQIVRNLQNKGIGTNLLNSCMDQARQLGQPTRLQVLHFNKGARRLYERLGFKMISKLEHHYLMEAV